MSWGWSTRGVYRGGFLPLLNTGPSHRVLAPPDEDDRELSLVDDQEVHPEGKNGVGVQLGGGGRHPFGDLWVVWGCLSLEGEILL